MVISAPARVFSVKEIIDKTAALIKEHGINPGEEKYRELVLIEAEKYQLNENHIKELARHLKIDLPSPPANAKNWILSICKIYMSAKYTNPVDPREYILMVSSKSFFGVQGVIHYTQNGYLDTSWFKDFIMDLDKHAINYERALKSIPVDTDKNQRIRLDREFFSKNVNDPINQTYSGGITIEQLRVAHAFFKKYLPVVEGICNNCFKLSFPLGGAGARWVSSESNPCEIRLSEPKPDGWPSQQKLYVTHNYKDGDKVLHVKWNGIYTDKPEFTSKLRQADTHIPWMVYEYEKLVNRLPIVNEIQTKFAVCQCKKIV